MNNREEEKAVLSISIGATCGDCENATGCIINGDKYPWSKVCGDFSPNCEYRERTSLEAMAERIESLEKRLNKLEGAK